MLAVSDAVLQTIVTAVCGVIIALGQAFLLYRTAKLKAAVKEGEENVKTAVQKGEKTAAVTAAHLNTNVLDGNKEVSEIKQLINGPLTVALKSTAKALRRIADMTKGTPSGEADELAAAAAEKASAEHAAKQAG